MFKAVLTDIPLLKDPMVSISELIDEGNFVITKDGIRFTAADRAMVSVVDYFLSKDAFDSYEATEDHRVGLNILNFLSVVKRAGKKDKITFEIEDAKLKVTIEGDSKRKFFVPMLNLEDEEIPPIDKLDFKSKVVLKSDVVNNGIDDALIIGDSVIMTVGPERFSMVAEDNVKKSELELKKDNEALIEMDAASPMKSRYAIDYLSKMMKGSKMSDIVTLKHGTDYPLKIEFNSGEKAKLSFILAPRVTEN